MKLSEAILLGSTTVEPMAYGVLIDSPSGPRGCAYGMAIYAIGIRDERELDGLGGDKTLPAEWCWSANKAVNPGLCKCSAKSDKRLRMGDYRGYITHYFNEHVMRGSMTLEQLVDYVRSVEPPEPADYSTDWRDEQGLTDVRAEREVYNDQGVKQ